MGCSSSALNKTGDSSRFRSGVPSNEAPSTGEQSKFCVAQPTPCTPGREAALYGNAQRASHAPSEKPKASVVPTANGVKSCHQPSLANDEAPKKDAPDQSGPTKETGPLVQGEESELPQPGGEDGTLGMEETKKGVGTRTEAQSLKGTAETEPLGTEARSQPPRTPGERESPGAGEDTEILQTAGVTKLPETAERTPPLETAKELPPEVTGKNAQPHIVEAIPKESNSAEMVEGHQPVGQAEQKELQETLKDKQFQLLDESPKENSSPKVAEGGQSAESSEEQQPRETPCKDEQPQLLETVLKENETPQTPDRSQLVQTPGMNQSLCETPDGTRTARESQPEAAAGSREQLAGTAETAPDVEMAREIHTDEEEQRIEGETGETVEAKMKNERESEEAEAKEKETGEAVGLGAAGESDGRASAHSAS
ncbi:glutamate-rich protein 5 [Peromyscus californicus insignis]|uniref:glutamate-rich protein 5 n=1 Tax=Peromyscus californicus insignis TaxID=564181 RepID=UPI0022A710F0|nr:glutamate-rich protein 5 [Peromyscus californicus insignis]